MRWASSSAASPRCVSQSRGAGVGVVEPRREAIELGAAAIQFLARRFQLGLLPSAELIPVLSLDAALFFEGGLPAAPLGVEGGLLLGQLREPFGLLPAPLLAQSGVLRSRLPAKLVPLLALTAQLRRQPLQFRLAPVELAAALLQRLLGLFHLAGFAPQQLLQRASLIAQLGLGSVEPGLLRGQKGANPFTLRAKRSREARGPIVGAGGQSGCRFRVQGSRPRPTACERSERQFRKASRQ